MYGFIHVHNTHACTHKRTYRLAWRGVVKISEPILLRWSPIPRNNIIIIWSISNQNMYERLIAFTCCPCWDPLVDVKCNMFGKRCLEIIHVLYVRVRVRANVCTPMYVCMCVNIYLEMFTYIGPFIQHTHTHTFCFCTFFEKKTSLSDHWLQLLYIALIKSSTLAALILYICAIHIGIFGFYPFV